MSNNSLRVWGPTEKESCPDRHKHKLFESTSSTENEAYCTNAIDLI